MDQLIALPVKGEAFLLQRDRYHILVDGGGGSNRNSRPSGKALSNALLAVRPNLRKLDVVVCTHADGDHAAGLASFLDYWWTDRAAGPGRDIRVKEFWLP